MKGFGNETGFLCALVRSQEAVAVGIELETSCLGRPGSYFMEVSAGLEKNRDEMVAVLREVGFTPIIPDGTYFMVADTSSLGQCKV